MYIIVSTHVDGSRLYWTGRSGVWSVLKERAHVYKAGKAAASALMKGRSNKRARHPKVWARAEFVTSHGW